MKKTLCKALLALALVTPGVINAADDISTALGNGMAWTVTNAIWREYYPNDSFYLWNLDVTLFIKTNVAYGGADMTILATNFGFNYIVRTTPLLTTNGFGTGAAYTNGIVWAAPSLDGSQLLTFCAKVTNMVAQMTFSAAPTVIGCTNLSTTAGAGSTNAYRFVLTGRKW
jgi:hypothetical protein